MKNYSRPTLSLVELRQEERIATVIPGTCLLPDPETLVADPDGGDMEDTCWKKNPEYPCS